MIRLRVDGKIMLAFYDLENRFPQGSIAVIFWENDKETPVDVSVKDMKVKELI